MTTFLLPQGSRTNGVSLYYHFFITFYIVKPTLIPKESDHYSLTG